MDQFPVEVIAELQQFVSLWPLRATNHRLYHTVTTVLCSTLTVCNERGDGCAEDTTRFRATPVRQLYPAKMFQYVKELDIHMVDTDGFYATVKRIMDRRRLLSAWAVVRIRSPSSPAATFGGGDIAREGDYCRALARVLESPTVQYKHLEWIQINLAERPALYFAHLATLKVNLDVNASFMQYLRSHWNQFEELAKSTLKHLFVESSEGTGLTASDLRLLYFGSLDTAGFRGVVASGDGDGDGDGLAPLLTCSKQLQLDMPFGSQPTPVECPRLESLQLQQDCASLCALAMIKSEQLSHLSLQLADYRSVCVLRQYPKLTSLTIQSLPNVALNWPAFFKLGIERLRISSELVMPYVKKPFAPTVQSRFDSLRFPKLATVVLDLHWQFAQLALDLDLAALNDVIAQFKRWCPRLSRLVLVSDCLPADLSFDHVKKSGASVVVKL